MAIVPEEDKIITYRMSSIMHGIMMENIDNDYVEYLHTMSLRPYSQYLSFEDKKTYWNICTLNKEAYERIIIPLFDESFSKIKLNKHEINCNLTNKSLCKLSREELSEQFYQDESDRFFRIRFLTPTAFKQNGKYTFYPNLRCIYQSLMKKYDAVCSDEQVLDEEVLNDLVEKTNIFQYNLKSTYFPMEGVKIPAFVGNIIIKSYGTHTMNNFLRMLFRFGEYSGVGIKSGIGMGAIKIEDKEAVK